MHAFLRRTTATLLVALPGLLTTAASEPSVSVLRHDRSIVASSHHELTPRIAPLLTSLVLDDGSHEADVGFNSSSAFQFLWFNRFDSPTLPGQPFDLTEIQVLFPSGPGVVPGAAVQLVVFSDADGDPTNGAVFVGAFDDVIQFADDTTFSVYAVNPPLRLEPGSGDLLVGVVNRFVTSGVSPSSRPAALDTTTTAGRSFFALWTGDPPDPPALPSDSVLTTIDTLEPGTWMIRAAGTLLPLPVVEIPTLGGMGLALLAALLTLAAAVTLRRQSNQDSH